MKTIFKTLKPGFLILAVTLAVLLSACSDDTPDIRDQATGQFAYTVKIYEVVGNDLVYLGDQGTNYDITGTLKVAKNSGDPDALDFYDGNILMFQGIDVRDAGNALVFDVPTQEAWVGPGNVQVAGYPYWNVNSNTYHGAFLYDSDELEIAFETRIMDIDTYLVMIMTAVRK
jgi:hypothetical protein